MGIVWGPIFPGWWFQIFFIFSPTRGRFRFFDSYFSDGLKPPTSNHLSLFLHQDFHFPGEEKSISTSYRTALLPFNLHTIPKLRNFFFPKAAKQPSRSFLVLILRRLRSLGLFGPKKRVGPKLVSGKMGPPAIFKQKSRLVKLL